MIGAHSIQHTLDHGEPSLGRQGRPLEPSSPRHHPSPGSARLLSTRKCVRIAASGEGHGDPSRAQIHAALHEIDSAAKCLRLAAS